MLVGSWHPLCLTDNNSNMIISKLKIKGISINKNKLLMLSYQVRVLNQSEVNLFLAT